MPPARRILGRLTPLAALVLCAGAAAAQEDLRPPQPEGLAGAPTILTILVAAVLVGLVILAGVFPSKRGHQD